MQVLNLALSAALLAVVVSGDYTIKESHAVPLQFTWQSIAPRSLSLRLSIGLRQSRFDELEQILWQMSDPDHERYGQYLNASEVQSYVQPSAETLDLVHAWLQDHNINDNDIEYSPAKDYLTFTMPIDRAERLLNTTYSVYRHDDGTILVRTPQWSLPENLHEHIDTVQPTTSFLRTNPRSDLVMASSNSPVLNVDIGDYSSLQSRSLEEVCNRDSITPLCLKTLDGFVNYTLQAGSKSQIALCDYLGQVNNRSDIELFLRHFRPDAVAGAYEFKQISVHGGTLQQTPDTKKQLKNEIGLEGNLDAETILGLTYSMNLTAYSTKGKPPYMPDENSLVDRNDPYMPWLNYILAQDFIPQVISNSYVDDEQTVPKSYADAVCRGFVQLGARGVSFFLGSGDGGVSGVQTQTNCKSNVNNETTFISLFPATCPYVTAVGGTVDFHPEVVGYDPRPAFHFMSGGGFSNYFKRPAYQETEVANYLTKMGDQHSHYYNKSGRAYPDLAAYAVNFTIGYNSHLRNVDGTSAATPTIASIFALLNDALIANGRPVMGFINPWLYKRGKEAFVDVTRGSTIGCNTTGFKATVGWDAASGFGTPRFQRLLQAVGLPSEGSAPSWPPSLE